MAANLHISISAESLFEIGDLAITNSMLTSLVVSGLLIAFALAVRSNLKQTNKPEGLQNVAEWVVESLQGLIQSVTNNSKKTKVFFPFIATFLLFILFNNWIGLLPGVGTIGFLKQEKITETATQAQAAITTEEPHTNSEVLTLEDTFDQTVEVTGPETGQTDQVILETEESAELAAEEDSHGPTFVPLLRPGTADLNTTLALALISVFITQLVGIRYLGLSYFKKFINFSNPINFFVGLLEIVSEFAKIISFAFRLFGNIFAGEVLLVVIGSLIPIIAPMPFYGLEIFVGFIQALVFAMLSLVFFNMATQGHDEH